MPSQDDPELWAAALAATGQLRECVAAAANLEHLVTSIHVGPHVLGQVIPDVARQLGHFDEVVCAALDLVAEAGLVVPMQERTLIVTPAREMVGEMLTIVEATPDQLPSAKTRLALERTLGRMLPVLTAVVGHMELLLEACQSGSSEMSIFELLTSIPERGSERPHRPVAVAGAGLERLVAVPPRVALKALALWSKEALGSGKGSSGLLVGGDSGRVEFSVAEVQSPELIARLPVCFPASYTGLVVRVALGPFGGHVGARVLGFDTRGVDTRG